MLMYIGSHLCDVDEEHFWSKVDVCGPEECWAWKQSANKSGGGYGQYHVRRLNGPRQKGVGSHKMAWVLACGPVPDGLHVRHRVCDNPICCNPFHLALGTNQDNMDDKVRKGRGRCGVGERNGCASLTEKAVFKIRDMYRTGHYTQHQLATLFGLSQSHVSRIIRGRCWACVKDAVEGVCGEK